MTSEQESTLVLERVPLPNNWRSKRESLPPAITETLQSMEVGQSFFVPTQDREHTQRKMAALRSRCVRFQKDNPDVHFFFRTRAEGWAARRKGLPGREMKITNRFDLPDVVVRALVHSDYSRGDSVRSVTQLIDSPRIGILQREHDEEIEQDCVDFLWSRFGTSVHTMFEVAAEGQDCISEERLFVEHQGWKISGAIDLQHVEPDGVIISDYKVTSVWSVIYDKQEWHDQLNAYAWMVRHAKGLPVKQARIIAILRDWQRRKAQEDAGYSSITHHDHRHPGVVRGHAGCLHGSARPIAPRRRV